VSIKIIDQNTMKDEERLAKVKALAASAKEHHTATNTAKQALDSDKKAILAESTEIFFADGEEDEWFQSHEYHTDDGIVRVSFRTQSHPIEAIGGEPADAVLKKVFGSDYDDLFVEDVAKTVTASQEAIRLQAASNPDLFAVRLKEGLTPSDLSRIVSACPDLVQVAVLDVDRYKAHFPMDVDEKSAVHVSGGFVEKLGKIAKPTLERGRAFITGLLKKTTAPQVVIGNAAKK